MSESPKMGLFGSKDETKETKKETKDNSPNRYAPYCIDSDSETYDTEALSIMDINDIIGVQSEPVSDSTLESEIAALSQMITESKTDAGQNTTEKKLEIQEKNVTKDKEAPVVEKNDTIHIFDTNEHIKSTLKELENVCCVKEISDNIEQSSKDNFQFSSESSLQENVQLCEQEKDNDIKDNHESNVLTDSVDIVSTKGIKNSNSINEVTVELIHSISDSISVTSEIMKSDVNVNKSNVSEKQSSHNEIPAVNSKVTIIENENSIRGSLQLIGEAYSSEDSQDEITNDEEPNGTNSTTNSTEKCLIPCEEKKDINEVCEVQKDVNNISEEIDNIHLDKACTNENAITETMENEKLCSSEIESSNCPVKPTYAEELSTISKETKDVVPNEYKVDNLSTIDLQCEKENINTTTTDTNNIKEEMLEEKKIDIQIVEETIMMEHSESEVENKNIETVVDVYVTEEQSETKVKDENVVIESDQETTEDIEESIQEERHDKSKECTDEEKERNQENVEHVNNSNIENKFINNDQVSNVESNDEVSIDNDTEVIEEEIELNVKPVQSEVESEDINNSTTIVKVKKIDTPHEMNNTELPKGKANEAELSELKENMEIEKLETIETELQDSLELLTNQLSPQTTDQTNVILNESSMLSEPSSSELPLNNDDVIDNITNIVVSAESNIVENEENQEIKVKNNLKSVLSEAINSELKEDIVGPVDEKELPSIQEKIESELETNIPETCDTVDKYEVSMEVDLNVDPATSILETATNEIREIENSSNEKINQLLKEDTDKITQEMEINLEVIKVEDHIPKEQDQESNKVEHTLIEEGESEIVQDFYEVIESKNVQIIGLHDNIEVEKQTEVDKQVEEQDTMEKGIEEENITKEQIEEENIAKKQTEEEDISEKQKEEDKKQIEEDINETQIEEDISEKQIEEDKKEGFSPKIATKEEQSTEVEIEIDELQKHGNICNIIEENHSGESEENVIQKEEDVKAEETNDYANQEESASDLKFINKDPFPMVDHTEIIAAEEEIKEEHMEEEVTLALESEENESQSEIIKNDIEEKPVEGKDVELPEEIMAECQENVIIKVNDSVADSINLERSSDDDMNIEDVAKSNDAEHLELNKNEELSDKLQLEDDSKSDTNKDNLKDILETANNVEEIFSGEQCQNTEDIVTSILDDVRTAADFKNILSPEVAVANEIEEVLQQSGNLPLVESEIEELNEKLPQDSEDILNKDSDMEDSISTQNIDTLEGLLGLDLMPEGEDSTLKMTKTEEELQKPEQLSKVVNMRLLLEQSNHTSDIAQASDYITHVISSCLTDRDSVSLEDTTEKSNIIEVDDDKGKDSEAGDILKIDESLISESMDKDDNVEDLQKDLREGTDIPDNELDMDFEEAPLESVGDLEETESKLELTSDILLHNVDQGENLNDAPSGVETSQPSSEISELESAVKFLQESEEQAMDSPLVLSPKMVESVVDDISKQADASSLFVPDEDMCENAAELEAELQNIATDSISISEAEIISEAAKLESERKLAEQIKIDALQDAFGIDDDKEMMNQDMIEDKITIPTCSSSEAKFDVTTLENIEVQQAPDLEDKRVLETVVSLPQNILKTSESIPKVSILEERLKEPPKIEIPATDVTKVSMSPTTSKDSLLIQKDAKLIAYQKMLESPKLFDKSESKFVETPRKDSEKHDFENVGSPRIILKIAKSAITDCGEPRSPKSPKIRSATNSPNPEDSPGQKLGKIKLKLSKGGHPSIISNENVEELGQWYSEGSSSLSPIGMKIKLSKSGDASIVTSEKHELIDDSKEGKHKFEETKRTESPIGMKIKLSKSGDASIVQQDTKEIQMKHKDKLDMVQGSPKRTESPIGMKIKLSKTGDASIIQPERQELSEEYKDNIQMKPKEKLESCYDSPKRTDSPIGMKIKLSKSGDASIVSPDLPEESKEIVKMRDKLESPPEIPKRTDSPIGMKIKLAKTKGGGASIISVENSEESKDKLEIPDIPKRTESPLGMKIKLSKSGDASIVHSEVLDEIKDNADVVQDATKSLEVPHGDSVQETVESSMEITHDVLPKVESPIGMKIKLSKSGDASIVSSEKQEQLEESKLHQEIPKRTESPLGMKIKLSKTGDASIIQPDTSEDTNKITRTTEAEHSKIADASLGMKIKLLKTGDASIVDSEKKDRQQRRRDTESSLEMKIKLSKTGHPTIVACDNQAEVVYKSKESTDSSQNFVQRYKETGQAGHKEPALKILKTGHSTILQSNRSELTIEPVQMQGKKLDNVVEMSPKRKDITIAPIESKKSKLETQLTQILPEVTIQPVTSREQKQFLFDPKNSAISLQQMNVINQEISITQVRPQKSADASMNEKLKDILSKNVTGSPMNSDCEIIEHRPELIIVNENSNSSQDVVIIEEVSPNRMPEVKVPKKRGRPRRNPLPQGITHPPPHLLIPRDPLSLDDAQQMQQPQIPHFPESRENERPKRTCRSQKSYAPPKRGRGRGRGKRKLDNVDPQIMKKPRIDQDLNAIEASTTAVITIDDSGMQQDSFGKSSELYKALKQPAMDSKMANSSDSLGIQPDMNKGPEMRLPKPISNDVKDSIRDKKLAEIVPERMQKAAAKVDSDNRSDKSMENVKSENKDMLIPPGHPNWLTPASKRVDSATKHENMSTVQVIDEETRMSAESGSRSQTPARNISAPASETIVNEESQGSVLSTATTESEKVKVKNRRMEINFDPDEGPFTVDKIAEYEWPLDRKGETFMIQEQISQYLGVKSFKRKYPDLKRRVVDMEERNYLRENGLVSEAMCDMGLTAVCSSEVLDVMCSDFPDQYEEYRKHMREKQVKEHSKKQKELTAAANAEKNRIDLAEMAVQSALSWNISLNKARRENRKCSLDLQTFTIHVPKKQQKVETERRIGHYPVALIPGQYTDYYREYTPAELRYYPLNTVLYGPMRPNERKFDSQSEGSQSDSDSDSSSDDSSSSSSEGTQDTEGSQSTMDEVDMEIANQKDEIKLKCKMCLKALNKHSKNEVLIQCGTCNGHVHPSCIDLTLDMVPHIQSYAWQCTDCKTCAQCHDPADEDKMLFCDMCDRGYHIYCVGLRRVPQGRWHCQECAVCANCGSREPGGINSDRNSVAQWQHEYKKGDKNTRVYVSTLCVPCSKLWRKGRYCPHCSRCHTAPRLDLEVNLVHCSACDKYLHLGCVETKGMPLDRKNYLCDFCAPNRQ